jgi:hypothetical protein
MHICTLLYWIKDCPFTRKTYVRMCVCMHVCIRITLYQSSIRLFCWCACACLCISTFNIHVCVHFEAQSSAHAAVCRLHEDMYLAFAQACLQRTWSLPWKLHRFCWPTQRQWCKPWCDAMLTTFMRADLLFGSSTGVPLHCLGHKRMYTSLSIHVRYNTTHYLVLPATCSHVHWRLTMKKRALFSCTCAFDRVRAALVHLIVCELHLCIWSCASCTCAFDRVRAYCDNSVQYANSTRATPLCTLPETRSLQRNIHSFYAQCLLHIYASCLLILGAQNCC